MDGKKAPVVSAGSPRVWLTSLAVFGLALSVRLLHVWQLQAAPFAQTLLGDARGYVEWGRQLAAGDWIGEQIF